MKFLILLALLCAQANAQITPNGDYLQRLWTLSSDELHQKNLKTLVRFIELDLGDQFVGPDVAQEVLDSALINPVVRMESVWKYDPAERIGLCFGRAMFMDYEFRFRKVDSKSIKKAFVLGPVLKGRFDWHMATIVQSMNQYGEEVWLVLDPVVSKKVIDLEEWYRYWWKASDDKRLQFFIGENTRFASYPGSYKDAQMLSPLYKNYFKDLLAWFKSVHGTDTI